MIVRQGVRPGSPEGGVAPRGGGSIALCYTATTTTMTALITLPIGTTQLLNGDGVESVRLEFKQSWNEVIKGSVIPTICAFANDLQGLGGGYVILGVKEQLDEHGKGNGRAELPPVGLGSLNLDRVQKEIRGACKAWITPDYVPIIAPIEHDGRSLIVVYAPAGDTRPYQSKDGDGRPPLYWVRQATETVKAQGALLSQLLELTAKTPFDDRRRSDVALSQVSPTLLKEYLRATGSALGTASDAPLDVAATLRGMKLTAGTNGGEAPRNAALLFFTEDPSEYCQGAKIELAQLDEDGALIEQREFRGPLSTQVRAALQYIEALTGQFVEKSPRDPQARRFVTWPSLAVREALVNAIYHRGYDASTPTRIKLFPDRVDITSYPGPVAGLNRAALAPNANPPGAPPRNPRVGELLKALRLAETWQTGVRLIYREMQRNGSSAPTFEFDDERTYFRVTLPAHPEYVALHAIQSAALLRAKGDAPAALERVQRAQAQQASSRALVSQTIELASELDALDVARAAYGTHRAAIAPARPERAIVRRWARALLDKGLEDEARVVLGDLQRGDDVSDVVEQAILLKRVGELQKAHQYFQSVAADIESDVRALTEFASVKRLLARQTTQRDRHAKVRLNQEAATLLRRVVSMHGVEGEKRGWAWFNLAEALRHGSGSDAEIREAIEHARALSSSGSRLREAIEGFVRRP